jgi:hypothetical protein
MDLCLLEIEEPQDSRTPGGKADTWPEEGVALIGMPPAETLVFLLPSRYCEVDSELMNFAWKLFGRLLRVGQRFRQSAISYIIITNRLDPIEPLWTHSEKESASVAISLS